MRKFAGDNAEIFSAGIETHGVNPRAIITMQEDGIDISKHTSNNINEYGTIDFKYVITVCDNAQKTCPYFPSKALRLHYNFPDPAKASRIEEEILQEIRAVREMIKKYSEKFVEEYL